MFPADWADKKATTAVPQNNKRRKINQKEELKSLLDRCSQAAPDVMSTMGDCQSNSATDQQQHDEGVVGAIKRQVNNSRFAPAIPEELRLDHVLSSVPYREMLESLFGGVTGAAPALPLVTKAYEESYMREPGPNERQCAMGPKCECMFIDPNCPFVGVEFDLFLEEKGISPDSVHFASSQGWAKLCVLCSRKTTQKLFYDACYSGCRVQGVIQRYGNICNQPGEYAREVMLICPPSAQWQCLPLPIMSHQRNRYRVHVVAGRKHLQQLRVSFEDFVSPSDRAMQA
jgi:hypothetical protein